MPKAPTITVMHINIYTENSGELGLQFDNANDNIIDVTESRRMFPLGMVTATFPMNSHTRSSLDEFIGGGASSTLHRLDIFGNTAVDGYTKSGYGECL